MTTLKIKMMDGTPCDLSLRNGNGEKNHGGAVMRISWGSEYVEAWLSADDRKCMKGWL